VGESYNVGGRAERSNLTVVETICNILDRKRPLSDRSHSDLIQFVPDRPGHDLRYAIDPTKIETELGWRAERSFEQGLEDTVDWYLNNDWWWKPLRQQRYAGERLGIAQ
jgi:dTDP-glucose 4,6-dehydratase